MLQYVVFLGTCMSSHILYTSGLDIFLSLMVFAGLKLQPMFYLFGGCLIENQFSQAKGPNKMVTKTIFCQ